MRCLALDALPFVGAAFVLVLIWVAMGSFAGNFRFLSQFSAVSAQSAPNEVSFGSLGYMTVRPSAYALQVAAPALLAVAGLVWARFGPAGSGAVRSVLLATAGVSLMLLFTVLVRYNLELSLELVTVGLAWSVILAWTWGSSVRAAACGASIAALLAWGNEGGGVSQYLNAAVKSPVSAVQSVRAVFDRGARARAAIAELSPARFAGWPDEVTARDYTRTVTAVPRPQFAILGDSQMTYVLLDQRPLYELEMYDAGRISEQRNMLSELSARRPPYLILSQGFDQDGIPYDVRDPLLYTWMVRNFVPVTVFPEVDILRRRKARQEIPARFWTSQLGAAENLSYIPSMSDAAGSSRCTGGSGCVRYALASGRAPAGTLVTLTVSGQGRAYQVQFLARSDVSVYPVRLDRLWFSPLVGSSPAVTSSTPGFGVSNVGLRSGGNLY